MKANSMLHVQHDDLNNSLDLGPVSASKVLSFMQNLSKENLSFVVKRLIIHDGLDETLDNKIGVEFIRFIALRKFYSGTLVPSSLVDKFWHAFILYTEDYTTFCQRHLGEYMHHRPQDHFDSTASMSIASIRTKEYLEQMFPDYDRSIWSKSAICCDDGDCGCP